MFLFLSQETLSDQEPDSLSKHPHLHQPRKFDPIALSLLPPSLSFYTAAVMMTPTSNGLQDYYHAAQLYSLHILYQSAK